VIVSLDDDFLFENPSSLQYSRHFIAARQVRVRHAWQTTMNRLYMIESGFSLTGSMADHRIPLKPSNIGEFAAALAKRLGMPGALGEGQSAWARYLDAIVSDLRKPENKGRDADYRGRIAAGGGSCVGSRDERGVGERGEDGLLH